MFFLYDGRFLFKAVSSFFFFFLPTSDRKCPPLSEPYITFEARRRGKAAVGKKWRWIECLYIPFRINCPWCKTVSNIWLSKKVQINDCSPRTASWWRFINRARSLDACAGSSQLWRECEPAPSQPGHGTSLFCQTRSAAGLESLLVSPSSFPGAGADPPTRPTWKGAERCHAMPRAERWTKKELRSVNGTGRLCSLPWEASPAIHRRLTLKLFPSVKGRFIKPKGRWWRGKALWH